MSCRRKGENQMHLSTDGIIIREKKAGESDKYIVALTRRGGLISAYARGTQKIKSKNAPATSLLCYSDLTFFKSKGTYQLDEASAKEMFFPLRGDIVKLSLAQYFCELALCLAPEESEAEEFLRLMLNAFTFLESGRRAQDCIKAIVELRMLSLAGYMPDLTECAGCGKDDGGQMYFSMENGQIFCENCHMEAGRSLPVDRTVLAAMRYIIYSPFDRLFHFSLPDDAAKELTRVTERFLLEQTDRHFNTLDFYHSL